MPTFESYPHDQTPKPAAEPLPGEQKLPDSLTLLSRSFDLAKDVGAKPIVLALCFIILAAWLRSYAVVGFLALVLYIFADSSIIRTIAKAHNKNRYYSVMTRASQAKSILLADWYQKWVVLAPFMFMIMIWSSLYDGPVFASLLLMFANGGWLILAASLSTVFFATAFYYTGYAVMLDRAYSPTSAMAYSWDMARGRFLLIWSRLWWLAGPLVLAYIVAVTFPSLIILVASLVFAAVLFFDVYGYLLFTELEKIAKPQIKVRHISLIKLLILVSAVINVAFYIWLTYSFVMFLLTFGGLLS